jgi:apolipoprotein N-acyltransferase
VVLSAILATLAFPPARLGWLAWVAYAPLFWAVVRATRPRGAFALAYLFGILHFGALTTWVGVTVSAWSGTPLGWSAWVLLALIQGLWFGLFGWLAWFVHRGTAGDARLIALASAWVLVEWLRGLGGLAMPWGLAGYTQYRSLAIIQIAELCGVYGVSFLIALASASLSTLIKRPDALHPGVQRRSAIRIGKTAADVGVLVLPCLFYAGALTYGLLTMGLPWQGRPAVAAVVQPNFELTGTPLPEREALGRLVAAAKELAEKAPSLTVWPESAAPADAVNNREVNMAFSSFAKLTGGHHLVGTGYVDEMGNERNSAALFDPNLGLVSRYDKERLVPFGEWIPARPLFTPVKSIFKIPDEDLVAGRDQKPLEAGDIHAGVLICYESIFPGTSRNRVRQGADLLISITNDSWAGRSASLEQHYAMTLFRAIETRRYICVAGLTGISALISPSGAAGMAPPYRPALITNLVYLRNGQTPFVRWGDWLVVLCGIVALIGVRRGFAAP